MEFPIRVLMVEDSEDDALLAKRALERDNLQVEYTRVDSAAEFEAALERGPWDLVLADFSMPNFGALPALEIVKGRSLDLPFVIVSGTIGEETAVAAMRAGAQDYIMKDNLTRLPVAVRRELRQAADRRRDEIRIRTQLQQLKTLREIDLAITASLDPSLTFNVLLEQVISGLSVDAADVLVFDQNTRRLTVAADRGFRSNRATRGEVRLGEGLAGQVALSRSFVTSPTLSQIELGAQRAELFAEEGFIAYHAVPLIAKGRLLGVLEAFHRSPVERDGKWIEFFESIAGLAAIAIDNATLFEATHRATLELVEAYDSTLEGWVAALDIRDQETEGHTQRVTSATVRLARLLGFDHEQLEHVRRGALLHDIGKMAIPDDILLKPGPLTEAEWEIMRQHPEYARRFLSPIRFLRPALDIPYCHHEKWDGGGYPRGLSGQDIPLSARIFAVIDVWDALLSNRPYRAAWNESAVNEHIQSESGRHFDPLIVESFMENRASLK